MNPFELRANTIHIWTFEWPSLPNGFAVQAWERLTAEDREKAERFKMPGDKARFCTARALLRHISVRYLDCEGASLQMETGPHGKPFWPAPHDHLCFNVSHSGVWVALAFTRDRAIGIDVQKISEKNDFEKIARNVFHSDEQAALAATPEIQKRRLFFDIWACKEAAIKAAGQGLHGALEKFAVTPLPEGNEWLPLPYASLAVRMLMIDEAHAGALAVAGDKENLHTSKWGLEDAGWQD